MARLAQTGDSVNDKGVPEMKARSTWIGWFVVAALTAIGLNPARAQDEAAVISQVSYVAGKLEGALRDVKDSPLNLQAVRIRYLLARTESNAFLRRETEPTEADLLRDDLVVCLPTHPLFGEETFAGVRDKPLDFSVVVGKPLIEKVCEGDPTRLACIIGHELGHLSRGHLNGKRSGGRAELARLTRELEFEADREGLRYALAAGFPDPDRAVVRLWDRMREQYGEAKTLEPAWVFADHPSSTERIAELQTDPMKRQLWRAAVSFDDGVSYLALGAWDPAQGCFDRALSQFPKSPEVLANVGYVCLMRFYAGLPREAYARIGGELSCSSYASTRPPIRGGAAVDKTLLDGAQRRFEEALGINSAFYPALASLGAAITMDPDAGPAQLDDAIDKLRQAAQAAHLAGDRRIEMDALANLSVARARKSPDSAMDTYREAIATVPAVNDLLPVKANFGALLARSEAPDDLRLAASLLADYLRNTSGESYYNLQAARHWENVQRKLGLSDEPLPAPEHPNWARPTAVTLPNGRKPYLKQDLAQVCNWIGGLETVATDVVDGERGLWELPRAGVSLRGARGRLRIISLSGPNAPALELRAVGDRTGTGPRLILKVGETLRMVDADGNEHEVEWRELGSPTAPMPIGGRTFILYSTTGVAVSWEKDRRIAAIALVSG